VDVPLKVVFCNPDVSQKLRRQVGCLKDTPVDQLLQSGFCEDLPLISSAC
jgi:hypothetical protein